MKGVLANSDSTLLTIYHGEKNAIGDFATAPNAYIGSCIGGLGKCIQHNRSGRLLQLYCLRRQNNPKPEKNS